MVEVDLITIIRENWEIIFLYGLKYLKDISLNLADLKTIVKVHEAEIKNLKDKCNV